MTVAGPGLLIATMLVAAPAELFGQAAAPVAPPTPAGSSGVEGDPFKCWWRADKTAVHVGERFTIVLTCAVVEFGRLTAVPDLAPIEATAVRLTPFEVVSGTAPPEIRERPWRYVQRTYTVRLLGEGFFGQDVNVPSIAVPYAVHAEGPGGSTAGRTQAYVLPPLPIRVLSLVAARTSDIQDASHDTFATAEARHRRATNELAAAAILLMFSVVLFLAVGGRALRGRLERSAVRTVPRLSAARLLAACASEIDRVRREAGSSGWTVELASRALPVLRIAAAVALDRPVTQRIEADAQVTPREGQVELTAGRFRRHRVMVSAPTTPATIVSRADRTGRGGDPRRDGVLETLREALVVFDAARYGRGPTLDASALDAAIEASAAAIRQFRPSRSRHRRPTILAVGASGAGAQP